MDTANADRRGDVTRRWPRAPIPAIRRLGALSGWACERCRPGASANSSDWSGKLWGVWPVHLDHFPIRIARMASPNDWIWRGTSSPVATAHGFGCSVTDTGAPAALERGRRHTRGSDSYASATPVATTGFDIAALRCVRSGSMSRRKDGTALQLHYVAGAPRQTLQEVVPTRCP